MILETTRQTLSGRERTLLIVLPLTAVVIHLAVNVFGGYGMFRDELYYIACSKRPDLGYVDHPSFSILILAGWRRIAGDSLFALRLLAALVSGLFVLVAGLIARSMGGKATAVLTATLAALSSPIFLAMGSFYSMNAFDILFWGLSALFLVRILNGEGSNNWYFLGASLGLGALNKIGILWLAAGIAAGILLTPARRHLKHKEPYIAAGCVLAGVLPYVIWNIRHDFATLEFIRNATMYKYASVTRADFLFGQVLINNPLSAPVWITGLGLLLFSRKDRHFRPVGIAFLTAWAILLINGQSKAEYLSPAYTFLFAAGGLVIERARAAGILRRWKPVYLTAVAAAGVALAPLAIPVLPVETFIAYQRAVAPPPQSVEGHELTELPQFFADRFGWEEMAATVSQVYRSLPESERATTVIHARNYGQASAMEYYSTRYPLPPVVSRHNSFWFWGKELMKTGRFSTVILIGGEPEDYHDALTDVQPVAVHRAEHSMPYENNLTIYIGRGLKHPLEGIWAAERIFI